MSAEAAARKGIPDATVSRLPTYLRALTALTVSGTTVVSSDELSALVGVGSAKLRKDLSHLGTYGVRGVGYDVERLTGEISLALGLTREWPVAIIGMGNLGRALAAYGGFANRGFTVIAAFDRDPTARRSSQPHPGDQRPRPRRVPRRRPTRSSRRAFGRSSTSRRP